MATAPDSSSKLNKPKNVIRTMAKTKDQKDSLLYVEKGGIYRGYRIHLLKEELPPYLRSFVICYNCEGILRDACGVGDPQVSMCLSCSRRRDSIILKPNREAVASLTVSCPLKSRGCGWEGKILESGPHLDLCGLFRLECQLSCGDVIERSDMSTHLTKNCPFREVQCEYCALIHKEKETNIHQRNCLEFPLKCSNECGDVLQRKNLKLHTEYVCENTIIECPYKEYGCEVKVTRKEMEQHKSENRLIHLEIKTDSLCVENAFLMKILLSEKREIFRINDIQRIGSEPIPVANFMLKNYRELQICISCSTDDITADQSTKSDPHLIIFGKIEPFEISEIILTGFIVILNQTTHCIHSWYEYCAHFAQFYSDTEQAKGRLMRVLTGRRYSSSRNVLANIPLRNIPNLGVCNDSVLVHLFYKIEDRNKL